MEDFLIDNEKLQQICRFYGLNMANFATKIGVKNQELYAISSLKQKEFSRSTMSAIAKFCPEVSPYWLITGEGSMLAGSIEQHNINGDNIGQQTNNSAPADQVEIIASQQRTIERLTKVVDKLSDK